MIILLKDGCKMFYYFTDTIKEVNACFNIGQYDRKMDCFLLY